MARPIDPRREEFRLEILAEATRVFAQIGYRNATTEDIARKVRLKKSSLYHYFSSKESLLYQALSLNLLRSLEPLEALQHQGGSPVDRLRAAVALQVKHMMNAPYVANLFLTERASLQRQHLKHCLALRERHEQVLRELVDEGVAQGLLQPVDSNFAVKLIFGALNGLPWWWRADGRYDLDQTAALFAELLVSRMLTQAAPRGAARAKPAVRRAKRAAPRTRGPR